MKQVGTTKAFSSFSQNGMEVKKLLSFQPNHLDNSASKTSLKTSSTTSTTNVIEKTDTPLDSPDSMKEIPLLSESVRSDVANGNGNGAGSVTSSTSKTGHSRQSSVASSHSNESGKFSLGVAPRSVTSSSEELGDCHHGIVVALHRKMVSL
jgi:hypothetical protein